MSQSIIVVMMMKLVLIVIKLIMMMTMIKFSKEQDGAFFDGVASYSNVGKGL